MSSIKDTPFNIGILDTRGNKIPSLLKKTEVIDIFDGVSNDFHVTGPFSISTFGRIGSEERDKRFSYIDIKIPIFHPKAFTILKKLKAAYLGILQGKTYARWSPEEKEFIITDEENGQTGFSFFLSHWKELKFKRSTSLRRDINIEFMDKFRDVLLTDKVLVLPAGLRDVEIMENGTTKYDEINNVYMKIISVSNTIFKLNTPDWEKLYDRQAWHLQLAFNEAFMYFENILKGKNGFWQSKYSSRRVFNGTRNVFSSMDPSIPVIGAKNQIKYTDSVVGLFQLSKSILPKTIHFLLNGYLGKVFGNTDTNDVSLINKKTLKAEMVPVSSSIIDTWGTTEGLIKIINEFSKVKNRNRPIIINGYYLGLIYKGPDKTFKIFGDIDELPSHLDPAYVEPLNLTQLIYLSGYREWNKTPAVLVRYPISGIDSIYPTTTYVKTTVKSEVRVELNDNWEKPADDEIKNYTAIEFPTNTELFHDSLTPHHSRLAGLSGDFDGDTGSFIALTSNEAIEEMTKVLGEVPAFINAKGEFRASCNVDTVARVALTFSGDY